MFEVAQQVGLELSKCDFSVCHWVPSRTGKRPLIVKFARRHTKLELKIRRKKLRDSNSPFYVNENLTFFRANLAVKLRTKNHLKTFAIHNEKKTMYDKDGEKMVFDNLAELYKCHKPKFVTACKDRLVFYKRIFMNSKKS